MKDIKKLLSSQAKDILPDENVKQNIIVDLGIDEGVKAYAHGGTEKSSNKKVFYIAVAAVLVVCITVFCVVMNIFNGGGTSVTPSITTNTITTEDFYAYGAASAGSILSARNSQSQSVATAKNKITANQLSDSEQQAADLVNEYIYFVEELLGGNSIIHSTTETEAIEGYSYSMAISYSNLLGENVYYTMYFNETQSGSKTDGGEVETAYEITGILVVDGVQYPVEGGRSVESETGETETELWFKAYTDENSYILIKQEYEEESEDGQIETEQSTEIYIYTDGKLTESVVAEMENEDGETELELIITKDNVKSTIEIECENVNDVTILQVKATIGSTKYSFKIYVENGSYRYVFNDGEYKTDRN
ncbi:MAG: hypothetical protein LUI60_01395 [Clostridia bacterium]|nr:hypothetical protein [Clostridia bacterium]